MCHIHGTSTRILWPWASQLTRPVLTHAHAIFFNLVYICIPRAKDVSGYLRKNSPFEVTEEEVRLPGSGKPITTLGKHTVLVRTKLSESDTAILAGELGAQELEEKAWVQVELVVEQMSVGSKGKRQGLGKEETEEEEEAGEEEEEEGEKKTGDMSV